MASRALGATGIEVSPIGLGTVKFGRSEGVSYATPVHMPDLKALKRLLAAAADLGVNLLDTAPAYGLAEERLGELLRGSRAQWVIASKAGEEFRDGRSYHDFSGPAIGASVRRSLTRLQTDWLDLVLVHSDGREETSQRFGQSFAALAELKRQGLIRATGFSGKTLPGARMALAHVDVLMIAFNPGYTAERPVIGEAHSLQKGVLIKKPLGRGHLAGQGLLPIMRFLFAERGVSSVVVGTLDPKHLAENVRAAAAALAELKGGA
jgi:aryl-alcohol dehydrogenase-like predicted oxidoreductase